MAHYKMGIYGNPAVGKSVFALGWPKPFFICTDENYEYLKPFGAKEKDHVQVTSWDEFKKVVMSTDFSQYETIVIDLIEDLYQWADMEYCKKNKIDDLGDVGYGKAYKIVRNDFNFYLLKILNQKANIILLSHQEATQDKTPRGIAFTSYAPSSYIPKKCWELINGKLRFFFRAHIEEDQEGDTLVKKRLLSIRPKANEFQINRGLDVDSLPDDIELSYKAFTDLFGKPDDFNEISIKETTATDPIDPKAKVEPVKVETVQPKIAKVESPIVKEKEPEIVSNEVNYTKTVKVTKVEEPKVEIKKEEVKVEAPKVVTPKVETPKTETPKVEVKKEEVKKEAPKAAPLDEKASLLAKKNAIRAKLGLPPVEE